MSGFIRVPGLPVLTDEYTGYPAVLRWLSITPAGRVVVREADNRIAYSAEYRMWVQWRLVRDVYRVVDPLNRGFGPVAVLVSTGGHGTVVVARDGGAHQLPVNGVATALLAAVGVVWDVHGTAAWLGALDPVTGLHTDLDRVDELRALAAHCRTG